VFPLAKCGVYEWWRALKADQSRPVDVTELAKLYQVAKNRLNFVQKLKDHILEPKPNSRGQELKAVVGGLQAVWLLIGITPGILPSL
jgi:shikimate kinase